MDMKMKWLATFLAAVVVLGGLITLKSRAAEDESSSSTPARGQLLKRLADKLDLSTDQRTQILETIMADKDTLQSLLGQWHQARVGLRTAIRADTPNEADVRAA